MGDRLQRVAGTHHILARGDVRVGLADRRVVETEVHCHGTVGIGALVADQRAADEDLLFALQARARDAFGDDLAVQIVDVDVGAARTAGGVVDLVAVVVIDVGSAVAVAAGDDLPLQVTAFAEHIGVGVAGNEVVVAGAAGFLIGHVAGRVVGVAARLSVTLP